MKLALCLITSILAVTPALARPSPIPNQKSQYLSTPFIHRPSTAPCNASQGDNWRVGYRATNGTQVLSGEITGCGNTDMGMCMPFDYDVDFPDDVADYWDRRVVQADLQRIVPDTNTSRSAYRTLEALLFPDELCNDTSAAVTVKEGATVPVNVKGNGTDFRSFFVYSK